MYNEAMSEWQRTETDDGDPRTAALIGAAYTQSGNNAALRAWVNDVIQQSSHSYVSPIDVAELYGMLGEKDSAMEWLEKGIRIVPSILLR
jgi:hypothetical protein